MADPLSITTGIVTLLTLCTKTGVQIKSLCDGAALADVAVRSLLGDVQGFMRVLQLMQETLDEPRLQASFQATGNIGNHWRNIELSICDGKESLERLRGTLDRVNKTVGVFDSARKHLRLKWASDEVALFQREVQSYKDTMQLSLQTVILWNQVTHQALPQHVTPDLDRLHFDVRRIASILKVSLEHPTNNHTHANRQHVAALRNLQNCVQSAASIVTAASTVCSTPPARTEYADSEVGYLFPPIRGDATQRWVNSSTVPEVDRPVAAIGFQVSLAPSTDFLDLSDDEDMGLYLEISRRAESFLAKRQWPEAERLLKICLRHFSEGGRFNTREVRGACFHALAKAQIGQGKWAEVEGSLRSYMALIPSTELTLEKESSRAVMLTMALYRQGNHAEARLYGRKALNGFRSTRSTLGAEGAQLSLQLLIQISRDVGDDEEREMYEIIMSILADGGNSDIEALEVPKAAQTTTEPKSSPLLQQNGLAEFQTIGSKIRIVQAAQLSDYRWPRTPPHIAPAANPLRDGEGINVIVVGDPGIGNSSFIHRFCRVEVDDALFQGRKLPPNGVECLHGVAPYKHPGVSKPQQYVRLDILDMSKHAGTRFLHRALDCAHVLLLCFDGSSQDSLQNCTTKWMREIYPHGNGVPVILAALGRDKTSYDRDVMHEAYQFGRRIHALSVFKTSEKSDIDMLFEAAARAGVEQFHGSPSAINHPTPTQQISDLATFLGSESESFRTAASLPKATRSDGQTVELRLEEHRESTRSRRSWNPFKRR